MLSLDNACYTGDFFETLHVEALHKSTTFTFYLYMSAAILRFSVYESALGQPTGHPGF